MEALAQVQVPHKPPSRRRVVNGNAEFLQKRAEHPDDAGKFRGLQQAVRTVDHPVRARGVKADDHPAVFHGDGVLRLVAVAVGAVRHKHFRNGQRKPCQPPKRLLDPRALLRGLKGVVRLAQRAAPAPREQRAGVFRPVGGGLEDARDLCDGIMRLGFYHVRLHRVAGEAAAHKDRKPVRPAHAAALGGQRFNFQRQRLVLLGNCHRRPPFGSCAPPGKAGTPPPPQAAARAG